MKFDASGFLGNFRKEKLPGFVVKYWWVWCLILITVFAFWTRALPARYGELQALDPFFSYRINEYMLANNLQIPERDPMRYWPDGVGISSYGPLMYFYVPVVMYVALVFFGLNMPFLQFAILYPAIMGAVSVFVTFWVGKEIFNDKKAGLFSAMFLATIPAYIARTSAGFFDKEATGGTFLLFAVYAFVMSYKRSSWKWGLLSGTFAFLAMGSWGGAQFMTYFISGFIIVKLLLNQFKFSMVKSVTPLLSISFLTQRYFLGVTGWPLEQILMLFVMGLVIFRFAAARYKLVREDQMPYLIPGLLVVLFIALLMGSMFSDFLWRIVDRVSQLIFLTEKGHIGSTVAEQMEGSWTDITSRSSITFSQTLIPLVAPFDTLFSIWFLMMAGSAAIVYHVYSRRNWLLLLPLIWLLMSIQTVFYMVRLVFFLAPPAALVSGYLVAAGISKFSRMSYMKGRTGLRKMNLLSLPVVALLSFLILTNLATGFVFSNSVGPSYNQWWEESMKYLREETPVNSSVLSWWDFGYWFQTKGERPSTADGGNINGSVNEQIADWFVSDGQNWTNYRPWLEGKDVSYILMDYTLPGKYGAISKIASRGKEIIGMLQMQQSAVYPQDNKTIIEFKAGQYSVWLPVGNDGNIAGAPIFMVSQGDQYIGRTYVNDMCTTSGIITFQAPADANTMPGCVTLTAYGLFYIPPEAEYSIFTNLMFMDGFGIPDVEKVFDNQLIKIYKLEINETAGA